MRSVITPDVAKDVVAVMLELDRGELFAAVVEYAVRQGHSVEGLRLSSEVELSAFPWFHRYKIAPEGVRFTGAVGEGAAESGAQAPKGAVDQLSRGIDQLSTLDTKPPEPLREVDVVEIVKRVLAEEYTLEMSTLRNIPGKAAETWFGKEPQRMWSEDQLRGLVKSVLADSGAVAGMRENRSGNVQSNASAFATYKNRDARLAEMGSLEAEARITAVAQSIQDIGSLGRVQAPAGTEEVTLSAEAKTYLADLSSRDDAVRYLRGKLDAAEDMATRRGLQAAEFRKALAEVRDQLEDARKVAEVAEGREHQLTRRAEGAEAEVRSAREQQELAERRYTELVLGAAKPALPLSPDPAQRARDVVLETIALTLCDMPVTLKDGLRASVRKFREATGRDTVSGEKL